MTAHITAELAYRLINERGLGIYSPSATYETPRLAEIAKELHEIEIQQKALLDELKRLAHHENT